MVYQTWAKNAFDSQMYRNVGKESAIMMIMLAAREYGIGPAQALNGGLHIIEGKVELSARMMSALIRKARHVLSIVESNDHVCTIRGRRADTNEILTVSFTIDEAQRAGLVKDKGGWKKCPTDMLYARAISRLARQLFSDVIGIGYVEGEISQQTPSNDVPEASANQVQDLYQHLGGHVEQINQYLDAMSKHFGWSTNQTIEMCCQNMEKTKTQYQTWVQKHGKVVDVNFTPTT